MRYFDKELLDKAEKGRVLAFCIHYTPKRFESEFQTEELLERLENGFVDEIYKIINTNLQWYERFELGLKFDGGWTGGYTDTGLRGTVNAHRYLIMHTR